MTGCSHLRIRCLNHYELVRKYVCVDCGQVIMCSCEEDFATKYLPHQLTSGTDLDTQDTYEVTLGFQPSICQRCRGETEEPHPKPPLHGRTTKVARYYWREIAFRTIPLFAEWATANGYSDWTDALRHNQRKFDECERIATQEVKQEHDISPKYTYQEPSQEEILRKYNVDLVNLRAIHMSQEEGLRLRFNEALVTPEEFAIRHFAMEGYQAFLVESVPFHVLFGDLMWMLIQHPSDPKVRMIGFGDRTKFDGQKSTGEPIMTLLPSDFGSKGYGIRRAAEIVQHIEELPTATEELLWTFDYWLDHSAELRQYLWAHRVEDVRRARSLLRILDNGSIKQILRYLVEDYWGRYLGWPDLIVFDESGFFLAEVKASRDKLSYDQRRWISDNHEILGLPFKLVKIHKA